MLTQLGLLLFLAYAGGRAGSAFLAAVQTPLGLKIIAAGAVVSAVHAAALLVISRGFLGVGGLDWPASSPGPRRSRRSRLRQLDLALRRAHGLGYALVYPVAMVTKIVITQILTIVA